jgi:acyl carrier protein
MAYDPKVIGPKFIAWLEEDTGKDDITLSTKLANIGFDGYNIFSLGQQIDELSWLHGVSITPKQIVKCKTVNDVVQLICS